MRALITGAAGFAGTHLAEHLLQQGDAVLGSLLRNGEQADLPEPVAHRINWFEWDLRDGVSSSALTAAHDFSPDCIYHLAALSIPSQCGDVEPNAQAWSVNVVGTQAVLDLAARLHPCPRVLLASSSKIYAPVESVQPLVSEDAPLAPTGGYGKTKVAAENAVRAMVRSGAIDAVIARAFNHTGPRQLPPLMVPEWAEQLTTSDSEPVAILCRDAYLDLSDVRDVVRAYRLLMERGACGEAYNVGSGRSVRSGDVLDEMCRQHNPQRATRELKPDRRQQPIADIARLIQATGWQPQIPLRKTLADVLDYWSSRAAASGARAEVSQQ